MLGSNRQLTGPNPERTLTFPFEKGIMSPRSPETDSDWKSYRDLRWRVLRAPWGQPREADVDEDLPTIHAMICDHRGQAVAVGRLLLTAPGQGQIRSMATSEDMRGQGLGRRVMEYLEAAAREADVTTIFLNARDDAAGFYAQLGYEAVGPGPTLFGNVRHTAMRKQLDSKSPFLEGRG